MLPTGLRHPALHRPRPVLLLWVAGQRHLKLTVLPQGLVPAVLALADGIRLRPLNAEVSWRRVLLRSSLFHVSCACVRVCGVCLCVSLNFGSLGFQEVSAVGQ